MPFNAQIASGSSMILAGPTNCGKTTFAVELIKQRYEIFDKAIDNVVVITPHQQSIYDDLFKSGNVDEIINTIQSFDDILKIAQRYKNVGGCILLLDDIALDLDSKLHLNKVFTEICHHYNLFCIFFTQNLFLNNPDYRTMSLNSAYLVLFKNPRDQRQITHLASSVAPLNTAFITQSFFNATQKAYSYLLMDFLQQTPNFLRLRTNILPHEAPMTIFVEKK